MHKISKIILFLFVVMSLIMPQASEAKCKKSCATVIYAPVCSENVDYYHGCVINSCCAKHSHACVVPVVKYCRQVIKCCAPKPCSCSKCCKPVVSCCPTKVVTTCHHYLQPIAKCCKNVKLPVACSHVSSCKVTLPCNVPAMKYYPCGSKCDSY